MQVTVHADVLLSDCHILSWVSPCSASTFHVQYVIEYLDLLDVCVFNNWKNASHQVDTLYLWVPEWRGCGTCCHTGGRGPGAPPLCTPWTQRTCWGPTGSANRKLLGYFLLWPAMAQYTRCCFLYCIHFSLVQELFICFIWLIAELIWITLTYQCKYRYSSFANKVTVLGNHYVLKMQVLWYSPCPDTQCRVSGTHHVLTLDAGYLVLTMSWQCRVSGTHHVLTLDAGYMVLTMSWHSMQGIWYSPCLDTRCRVYGTHHVLTLDAGYLVLTMSWQCRVSGTHHVLTLNAGYMVLTMSWHSMQGIWYSPCPDTRCRVSGTHHVLTLDAG